MSDAPTPAAEEPAAEPVTGTPGMVSVCPACGTIYDTPQECANGHPPAATFEVDPATLEAARAGDEEAAAKVAAAAGGVEDAGAVHAEADVGAPAPVEVPAEAPAEAPTAAEEPAPPEPAATPITDALVAAKNAIETAILHASGH